MCHGSRKVLRKNDSTIINNTRLLFIQIIWHLTCEGKIYANLIDVNCRALIIQEGLFSHYTLMSIRMTTMFLVLEHYEFNVEESVRGTCAETAYRHSDGPFEIHGR